MPSTLDTLTALPCFARVPRHELERATPHFTPHVLAPREVFWTEGAPVTSLALLVLGELAVLSGGTEVARLRAPELVGEASAFFPGQRRAATLTATRPSALFLLDTRGLQALWTARSRVYDALLDTALVALATRVEATNRRLSDVATGGFAAPQRREPGTLARLWRTLRPGGPAGPCPPLSPLLRQQAGLDDADDEVLAAVAAGFVAEPLEEGQVVVLEGEPGWCGYVVAEGTVEVLRNVRGDRAELLARLGPGRQFGMNTLVVPGARTASCVAATPGWVYRIEREAHEALAGAARRAWRESVLAVLAGQVRAANTALERATRKAGRAPAGDDGFASLLAASGFLETAPPESVLERVQFVVDEDKKRNPRDRLRRG